MENERAYYEAMTTEELQAIIRADTLFIDGFLYPQETIFLICHILAERRPHKRDAEASLKQMWARYYAKIGSDPNDP